MRISLHFKLTIFASAFLMLMCPLVAEPVGATAESTSTQIDAPATRTDLVPPIPLTTEREQRIMDAVFSRFPDVEPGRVMDYLRDHFPHEVRYFTELSMRDVERSVEYLTRVVGDCAELLKTMKSDPERHAKLLALQKLELKAYNDADVLKNAAADAREQQRQALVKTLDQSFEIKQDLMRDELASLEKELRELREMIEKREKSKVLLINRRIVQITGENDGLEW